MPTSLQLQLQRWTAAGVIDAATADRIRNWESQHTRSQGLRWPTLIAVAFGALLLGAGVLLFVSAHWDQLSPAQRMVLAVAMVGVFHVAGAAVNERFAGLGIALHTTGTVALGAGIALAGQIFHLSAHWPAAILLWAVGALIAWALLRHWTQAALVAILVPYWLAGEWWDWTWWTDTAHNALPIFAGVCALSFTYLGARRTAADSSLRKALGWIGGIALLPAVAAITIERSRWSSFGPADVVAWLIAIGGPVALAGLLRGREAAWNVGAAAWTLLLAVICESRGDRTPVYVWCALGSVGVTWWGIRDARPERINLGIAGFAITVFAFYFSNVMDKLGRSASLIGLGLLFLAGGWMLERTRRRLIDHIRPEAV